MKISPPENYRFWIFDMDGTLTIAAHDFDAIRSELGIEPGRPILEAIAQMPASEAAETSGKLHQLELDIAAESRPQPQAAEMLDNLQDRGRRLGILTRNAKDIAHVTLEAAGLARYFADDVVIGREQCEPKPDPAGIRLLMHHWQCSPNETVMIGDYVFDLQAGRNAGTATVHFDTSENFPWPEHTDFRISHLNQLMFKREVQKP